ncbi:MAG: metallophosphoesterase [Methyloprofundus sp.]
MTLIPEFNSKGEVGTWHADRNSIEQADFAPDNKACAVLNGSTNDLKLNCVLSHGKVWQAQLAAKYPGSEQLIWYLESYGPATPNGYAYSMLAPGKNGSTIIYARILLDAPNQVCPVLNGSDGSTLTTLLRPMYPDSVTSSASFPVTVCEAVMVEGVSYSSFNNTLNINAATLAASRVQVYGDSGCDPSDCPGVTPSTQFQSLANIGAKQSPNLILHMGDYNYRGTSGAITGQTYAYDAGDGDFGGKTCGLQETYYSQNAANSPRPDSWPNWQADFFDTAQNLLPKAPWVFARGNHELCSRAGPGWFYFMGPGSSLPGAGQAQIQCPDQGDLNSPPATAIQHITMIPPYMLPLSTIDVWVMDTANACDDLATNDLTAQYQTQYEQLANTAKNTTWVMSHRPIWGFWDDGTPIVNQMLQTALANSKEGELPSTVQLSLAGHMHIFESLSVLQGSTRPPQVVIGNSGVSLESTPANGNFTQIIDGQLTAGNAMLEFGFLSMSVGGGAWSGEVLGTEGNILLNCDSGNIANGQRVCLAAPGS